MQANEGKRFEEDFKNSVTNPDISIDRVKDSMGGFRGVNSICDFMVYKYPNIFYLELKSVKGHLFPISNIRANQLEGLLRKSKIPGVYAGFLVNYRLKDGTSLTYYIPVEEVLDCINEGYKSITNILAQHIGVPIEGIKKRVRYKYEVPQHLDDIVRRYWDGR